MTNTQNEIKETAKGTKESEAAAKVLTAEAKAKAKAAATIAKAKAAKAKKAAAAKAAKEAAKEATPKVKGFDKRYTPSDEHYSDATPQEKKNFSNFAKLLTNLSHKVEKRQLLNAKKRLYVFVMKNNSEMLHTVEFHTSSKAALTRIRICVGASAKDQKYYAELQKASANLTTDPSGRVLNFNLVSENPVEEATTLIEKLSTII